MSSTTIVLYTILYYTITGQRSENSLVFVKFRCKILKFCYILLAERLLHSKTLDNESVLITNACRVVLNFSQYSCEKVHSMSYKLIN